MHFSNVSTSTKRNKVMSPEQFSQVVEAITEGRYSWACVLILRFAGYNPIHFIPYRTHSRLVKENSVNRSINRSPNHATPIATGAIASFTSSVKINELPHQEAIESHTSPRGGHMPYWLADMVRSKFIELNLPKASHQDRFNWSWLASSSTRN